MSQAVFKGFSEKSLHQKIVDELKQRRFLTISGVGNTFSRAFVLNQIIQGGDFERVIWLVGDDKTIPELKNHFLLFNHFQPKELVYTEQGEDTSLKKIKWLTSLNLKRYCIFSTPREFFDHFPSQKTVLESKLVFKKGAHFVLNEVFETLIKAGYFQSEDEFLEQGAYKHKGGVLSISPFNQTDVYQLDFKDEELENIFAFDQINKKTVKTLSLLEVYPLSFPKEDGSIYEHFRAPTLVVTDEIEVSDYFQKESFDQLKQSLTREHFLLNITSFPEEDNFIHLRYLSLLRHYNVHDFLNDLQERLAMGWKIILFSRHIKELGNLLNENELAYFTTEPDFITKPERALLLKDSSVIDFVPRSFQNNELKIGIFTDREIYRAYTEERGTIYQKTTLEFLTSLKVGNYVVHADHGIGRFVGIDQKEVGGVKKEYLEVQYAGSDRLFIPIDQVDKISKYLSDEDTPPRLTKLDSTDWSTVSRKAKKEAGQIAQELLQLYAKRGVAHRPPFLPDSEEQHRFEATFPYTETPGQLRAIYETKQDLEKDKPMDRLICGDVGFGKTEVALRAAFKAYLSGKQTALISPITILVDQHFHSFQKRMDGFGVKVEMLSRFRSPAEQKKILADLKTGKIDVIIGTHRLLQPDVDFKNLGLLIIDEEQKFGVEQKEKLKKFRCSVDVLTLTATPIPRTLNLSLNKLRDLSVINTPPPGRLPVITEVRKYNDLLIREAILNEIGRQGQVYFLYNKVQTIDGLAEKLKILVPEATFVVAHGQLDTDVLEQRILDFKNQKYDVLVSSTIIENGIDLPNVNTLIIDGADEFGLLQLYQLRGRVGRSKRQAYSYMLYHGQKLSLEAKKRLRAIVEASELGSGFQIAVKDMEIRGVGNILGVNQSGVVKTVGVGYFIKLLNQTIEELKTGKREEKGLPQEEISIELPLTSYIPDGFTGDQKEKLNTYQKMAALENLEEIKEYKVELEEEYGALPKEVKNLFKVLELKALARTSGLLSVRVIDRTLENKEAILQISKKITDVQIANLFGFNPNWLISGDKLKINVTHLGLDWYEGLKKSLEILGAKELQQDALKKD
ncbi:transcription-repair coupling factor [Candidatus Peregrinibacteria bacterium CG08_land_8_20_14_0_20_41_10]|nr:MAG: transcription-repair coupling factor [Candidatus Peregrinibacteria bacterium CG08_land_8_20_14_0_20_41_10]